MEEAHALQCTIARTYNDMSTDFLRAGSTCGLGIDVFGIRIFSFAARCRTAVNSHTYTLVDGFAKIRAAREYDDASLFAFSAEWNKKFLKTSMAHRKMEAYEYVRHLDHAGRPPRLCSATRSKCEILLYRSLHVLLFPQGRPADTL